MSLGRNKKTTPNIEGGLLKECSERGAKVTFTKNGSFPENERQIWGFS
jgi:hypothetical protein